MRKLSVARKAAAFHPDEISRLSRMAREFVIGFGPTLIAPLSTAIFQAQPALKFQAARLIIPIPGDALHFTIDDIYVNGDEPRAWRRPAPASAFSAFAVGVRLRMGVAQRGAIIKMSVTNTTPSPQCFSAALVGWSDD